MKVFDLLLIALFGLCVAVWWVFMSGMKAQSTLQPVAPPTDYKSVSLQETINTESLQPAMTVEEVQGN